MASGAAVAAPGQAAECQVLMNTCLQTEAKISGRCLSFVINEVISSLWKTRKEQASPSGRWLSKVTQPCPRLDTVFESFPTLPMM